MPYGYNYYDNNKNLFDSYGAMHGMHVSGIIGANDTKNNKYGVAPNAQILSLKVFSDDIQYPTTFTDIGLKAIDDAIKLKADVINMSLGTADCKSSC
ncbi:S8 family serine peptidase [Helcococcus bovis]|uniref:S8 family serine peptidase n=1 Tax=Helcococcus bovis TaxID=3153252 RepID=UPI0038B844E1